MGNEHNMSDGIEYEGSPFAQLDEMVEPLDIERPESVCFHFFFFIIKGQCDLAWNLLTKYSRNKIVDITYEEIQSTDEFYMQDEITNKEELRNAFESNSPDLQETFWLQFAEDVKLEYLVEYAEFRPRSVQENRAVVDAVFKLKDGTETKAPFRMIYEDSSWRMSLMEAAEASQPL